MSEENLKVVITGDASDLDKASSDAKRSFGQIVKSVQSVGLSLADLKSKLSSYKFLQEQTTDPKLFQKYGQQVTFWQSQIDEKMGKLAGTSRNANFAMISLGQGIGDLPYGFSAISNNIQQTIQAFSYLKTTSGGTSGALKALGSSLMGPTGLFIGFSLISSIITSLVQKYGSLGAAATALFGHLSDQEKAQKSLNDAIADSSKEVQNNITGLLKVQSTVDLAAKGYVSAKTAVSQFNKELGNAFGKVDSLTQAQNKLNESSQAYIQATIYKTVATKLFSQAAKAITDDLETQAKDNKDVATGWEKTINFLKAGFSNNNRTWSDVFKQMDQLDDASGAAEKRLSSLTAQNSYGKLAQQAQGYLKIAAQIAKQFGISLFGDDTKKDGKLKTISEVIADLNAKTIELDAKQKILGLSIEQVGSQKMKNLSDAMNELAKISTPAAIEKAKELGAQYDKIGRQTFLPILIGGRTDITANKITKPGVPTTAVGQPNLNTDSAKVRAAQQKELNDQFRDQLQLAGQLDSVFGDIFSTMANGGNALQGLIQAIEQLIIKLAAAAAAAAVLNALTGGGAAGFGAVFGQLSGLTGFIPSHAQGGYIPGPQLAVVGDAPGGEWVLNQKQISAILNGTGQRTSNMPSQITLRAAGSDLVAVIDTTGRKQNRRG